MASNELRRRNVGERKSNDSEEEEVDADDYATQRDLFGLISGALLVDPVRIRGENTPGAYERENIARWLNERGTSPTNSDRRVTVADLVPANDIQQEIIELLRIYPNAQIVRDWLKEQPSWYTQAIQRVRHFAKPAVQAMTRAVEPIRRNMPSVDTCSTCCAGAVVGAGVGACMGCSCAIALSGAAEDGTPMTAESKAQMAAFMTQPGAILGAAVGAVIGPEKCLKCAGGACSAACNEMARNGGKRKTRKGKQKKRRKTRKRKRKKTVKRKRKKRRKKSRRKRKK